jgi:hypothetical protein
MGLQDIALPAGKTFLEKALQIEATKSILSIYVDDSLWGEAMQALRFLTPCQCGISLIVVRSQQRSIRLTTKTLIEWNQRRAAIKD